MPLSNIAALNKTPLKTFLRIDIFIPPIFENIDIELPITDKLLRDHPRVNAGLDGSVEKWVTRPWHFRPVFLFFEGVSVEIKRGYAYDGLLARPNHSKDGLGLWLYVCTRPVVLPCARGLPNFRPVPAFHKNQITLSTPSRPRESQKAD
jgi:hypothetical protein